MNTQGAVKKRVLFLCLSLLLTVSLAACDKRAEEQDSTPPTASVQPTPTPEPTPSIPFTDVPEDSYYYDAVVWAYENGITSGDTLFEPLSTCTRGQVITFLWRAMGSPEPQITESPVSDISPSNWFYKPVLWAYESGISTSSAFKPNNPCTNGEALTFLWRAEGKPMAAVNSSAVALAASGAYYERPTAWADNNGLFAQLGAAFDPSAPCSRAYLMSYLYWAEEQWTSAAEVRALQAEYEQTIHDAQLYEVHGSGLIYADYVDVDNDGKVELLMVGFDQDNYEVSMAVYANINGHAEKACEGSFNAFVGNRVVGFSLCKADGHLYLYANGWYVEGAGAYYDYINRFYRLGKDAITLEYDLHAEETAIFEDGTYEYLYTAYTYTDSGKKVTESEHKTLLGKFTDGKQLCTLDIYGFSTMYIEDRGLLSTPKIQVNGTAVKLSIDPYISKLDNTFMVPLRDVLEAMGVAVYANSDASVILASTKSDTLTITYKDFFDYNFEGINSTYYGRDKTYKYSMNGGEFQKIAIEFTNGKAFLPLQTIVSLFGATAEWDGKAGAMQITANIPDSNRMTQDEMKQMANFDLKQAQKIALNKGYKGSVNFGDGVPTIFRGESFGDYETHVRSSLVFKNGKAVWPLGAVESEWSTEPNSDGYGGGSAYTEWYRIDVASDGTVTAYPNDKVWEGAGQV